MNILAFGAHPDDVEIYMFGALAAWAATGAGISIVIATDGAGGGVGSLETLTAARKAEAKKSASLLSVVPTFLDIPDGRLCADANLIEALGKLIATTVPDLIVTHAPNDYHADHRTLSEAVRSAASFKAPVIYSDTFRGVGFSPTHYIDISQHFALKANAIGMHRSQDPQRFVVAASDLNSFRASQCNGMTGTYAEAYRYEPVFPFADIRNLLPPAPTLRALTASHQKL